MNKLFNSKLYLNHRFKLIMFLDLFSVAVATLIAIFLDRNKYISELIFEFGNTILIFLFSSLIIYGVIFKIVGINKALWSYLGIKEIINICVAVLFASFLSTILYTFTFPETFSIIRFLVFSPLLVISGVMFIRIIYRAMLESSHNKNIRSCKNTLIIGAGDAGYVLLKELDKNNLFKAKVVGLIDDKRTNSMINGVSVLGTTYELAKIIAKYNIELVFLAIPSIKKRR